MNNKKLVTAGVAIIIVVIIVLAILILTQESGASEDEKQQLAQCLTEKGYSLAGTSWCPHCQDQKEMFGTSITFIDWHDCDEEPEYCEEKGINAYPSWISPLGTVSPGVKDFTFLREVSGC